MTNGELSMIGEWNLVLMGLFFSSDSVVFFFIISLSGVATILCSAISKEGNCWAYVSFLMSYLNSKAP